MVQANLWLLQKTIIYLAKDISLKHTTMLGKKIYIYRKQKLDTSPAFLKLEIFSGPKIFFPFRSTQKKSEM